MTLRALRHDHVTGLQQLHDSVTAILRMCHSKAWAWIYSDRTCSPAYPVAVQLLETWRQVSAPAPTLLIRPNIKKLQLHILHTGEMGTSGSSRSTYLKTSKETPAHKKT